MFGLLDVQKAAKHRDFLSGINISGYASRDEVLSELATFTFCRFAYTTGADVKRRRTESSWGQTIDLD
jgi:hypothetical protein